MLAAIRPLVRSDEDLATLAIGHVLDSDDRARHGLNGLMGVDRAVGWTTQDIQEDRGDGSPRPDLAGYERTEARAFIEAKFDAGLTANQPVEYLRRLSPGGHLAMLVPSRRVAYIRDEVLRRCRQAGFADAEHGDGWTITTEVGERRLSVLTWDTLLRQLLDATDHPDSKPAHDDLIQVRALVDAVQERLFTPLTDEQLTDGELPRTVLQLISLFRGVRDALPAYDLTSPGNYATHRNGDHTFTIQHRNHPLRWWAMCGFGAWRDTAPTPFWLGLHWDLREEYDYLLRPLLDGAPPRAYLMSGWNTPGVAIPLRVEPGADRAAVIESLGSQIRQWVDWGEQQLAAHEAS